MTTGKSLRLLDAHPLAIKRHDNCHVHLIKLFRNIIHHLITADHLNIYILLFKASI